LAGADDIERTGLKQGTFLRPLEAEGAAFNRPGREAGIGLRLETERQRRGTLPMGFLQGSAAPSALSFPVMLLSPALRGPTHCRPSGPRRRGFSTAPGWPRRRPLHGLWMVVGHSDDPQDHR